MIKINDKDYKLKELDCHWGKFTRTYHSVTKIGIAPRLFFFVGEEDNIKELLLELTITDEDFKNMPIGKELDMKEEVTDIGYSDNEGWLTLAGNDCTFKVTKLDSDKFSIKFKCGDSFENLFFEIDEEIKIEFPQKD
ncbi:MAG: hypothetical protein OSJ65_02925 [Bacilli bacterium]|nr:hypothetical protein [Bacilli bacterium]